MQFTTEIILLNLSPAFSDGRSQEVDFSRRRLFVLQPVQLNRIEKKFGHFFHQQHRQGRLGGV